MAVGPDKLKKMLLEVAKQYESQIDDALKNGILDQNNKYKVDVPKGMTVNHWSVLKSKYLELGWLDIQWVESTVKVLLFTGPSITEENPKEPEITEEKPVNESAPHAEYSETRQ